MELSTNKHIGEIVANDYRTATVFSKHKIDFCCNGNRSIEEACNDKNIDSDKLMKDLENVLKSTSDSSIDFQSWPIDLLADYIEKTHHRYVEQKLPEISAYLNKVCSVHGEGHPELLEIKSHFYTAAGKLAQHMKKEELVLFPFVRKMVKSMSNSSDLGVPHFGVVNNPIKVMMQEHDNEGERFRKIAHLSNDYTPPAEACNTYRVVFALLQEFEADLHKHIHLENNILFPKAIAMEKELTKENCSS